MLNNEVYCFWKYLVVRQYRDGHLETEVGVCPPASLDDSLELKDILKFCRICPIAKKNLRMLSKEKEHVGRPCQDREISSPGIAS